MAISMQNPNTVHPPVGRYHHVARVRASEFLFLAGQVAIDDAGEMVGVGDMGAQTTQAWRNVGKVLEGVGASYANIVQIRTYLVGADGLPSYLDARSEFFDEVFPNGVGPPNTLVFVAALFEEEMLVEIEVVAAL